MRISEVKKSERGKVWIFVALALFIIFSNNAFAISGSGGGIKVSSTLDSIGYTTDINGSLNYGNGGASIVGLFNVNNISGGFGGLNITKPEDVLSPEITLISPVNNSGSSNSNVTFVYDVIDASDLNHCTLYVDGIQKMMSVSPSLGTNEFTIQNLNNSNHVWNIICQDIYGNTGVSGNNFVSVLHSSGFDASSTNLSNVDIRSVPNFTIAKSGVGSIVFSGNTDLSQVVDLNSLIVVSDKTIFVDSNAAPFLNKPATLTINNINYQNVLIFKNGVVCNDCVIKSLNSGTLVFDVSGFSTYTITSTSTLNIYDTTDSINKYTNETITFYAEYTNTTSTSPISGTCDIEFNLGGWTAPVSMSYDGNIYTYDRSFDSVGAFDYRVTCTPTPPGFDMLTATDKVYVNNASAGALARVNISVINSSRMIDDPSAKISDSMAGNLTQMNINAFTQTTGWQGYYGNISATISLLNSNGSSFYDWSGIGNNGEIFASRSSSILWDSIACTSPAAIGVEDTHIGKSAIEADSVINTFNDTTHPTLNVLSKQLNNCPSRKLNGPNGTADNNFWNILISDNNGDGNIIYTGIVKDNVMSFANKTSDFELIVGARSQVDKYYFYVEIG